MSGFNITGRKEDVSMKLKAQNLKNVQKQTKQLEVESRKMEERLRELKLAMNREKEEREAQGGGFWDKGQHGAVTTYDKIVLKRTPEKPKEDKAKDRKTRKVKVLKDDALELPKRSKQPGTMAYIAQRDTAPPRNMVKGTKCGQCEQKAANVSCLECGEDYCAACFASFHIKGALRKHRSMPVQKHQQMLLQYYPAGTQI
ncbi:zinc finger B-box domain-containing protein 1-like [Lingula anatina]|uniref:Zinc finger B-box domain-containing protein 1-like n=1 Tax=Lingula anatina TaxID=7574 RepID=A0A2R2MM22_LINAN|nr:zinc finger B-box domain-containing protein 1-like [Lingula anatina]|eukprot:XP_023931283.1 zinc finger B-box domain-containing protein 1-like [Lingula anatina]